MKKIIGFMLILVMILSMTACGDGQADTDTTTESNDDGGSTQSEKKDETTEKKEEIVITVPTFKAGANVGAKYFLPQVERFNMEYSGVYKIEIEEVPQDDYFNKIKLLQQQGKLPVLIEGGEKTFIEDVIIPNGDFYDLTEWINSTPAVKDVLLEDSLAFNSQDGKIVSLPAAIMRPIGLYYNKEMFDEAGITKSVSEMTFEEFDQALEQLKASGYTPLSLMTAENAWTSMLLFSTILANEEGGMEIVNGGEIVYDYTSEPWVNAFARLQTYLVNYTTENALGAAYADSANNFLNERAAIIANGPWMVGDFYDTTKTTEGFSEKVGSDIYPVGTVIGGDMTYSWWIPANAPEDELEVALAFLEFIYRPEEIEGLVLAEGGVAPKVKMSDGFKEEVDPILGELNAAVESQMDSVVAHMYAVWPDQIVNVEFGKYLPKLALQEMTPEEFAEELTKIAQRFK